MQFYHDVNNDTIDLFVTDMTYVLEKMIEVGKAFTNEGLTAALNFAKTAAEIGKALFEGVGGLLKPQGSAKAGFFTISDYTGVAHETFDLFLADVKYLVGITETAASEFTTKGLTNARNFAQSGQEIFKNIEAGIKAGSSMAKAEGGLPAALIALTQAVTDAVIAIEAEFDTLCLNAYNAGYGFMTSLADGITAGLTYVESALTALAELFPHSPAKAGPLRVAPDWSAWMLGGLGDATNMVSSGLGWTMPRGLIPGTLGGGGATNNSNTTININNPVVRDEMDIRLLTQAISEALAGQSTTQRRLGATW